MSEFKALSRKRKRGAVGRPRKEGERYPSGDLKQSETQKEAMSTVIEYRQRVHGFTLDQSKDYRAGFTFGRISLDGNIKDWQYQAGMNFALDVIRCYKTMGQTLPVAHAMDFNRVGGRAYEGDENDTKHERAIKADAKLKELRALLKGPGSAEWRTLFSVMIEDLEHLRMMPEHQMGILRNALTALAWHYGIKTA